MAEDPRPSNVSSRVLYGHTAEEWRRIARRAAAALARDENDDEAEEWLVQARSVLREHADTLGSENTSENMLATIQSGRTSGGATLVGRTLRGLSPLGDEASGEIEALRERGPAQYDRFGEMRAGAPTLNQVRSARERGAADYEDDAEKLQASNPGWARVGDVAGLVGQGLLIGRALPGLGPRGARGTALADVRQGGQLLGSASRAMKAAGIIGAAEGAFQGIAGSGSIRQRLEDAAVNVPRYGIPAALGVGAGQVIERFGRGRRAVQRTKALNELSAADEQLLTRNRVEEIPLRRQTAEDRAVAARGAAERSSVETRRARAAAARAERALAEFEATAPQRQTIISERATVAPVNREIAEIRLARMRRTPDAELRQRLLKRFTPDQVEDIMARRAAHRVTPNDPREAAVRADIDAARRAQQQPTARVTPPEAEAPRLPPDEAPPMVAGTEYPPKPVDPFAEVQAARDARPPIPRQRGASNAQLGTRQTEIARGFLHAAPTEQSTLSIRALFANMPQAERETVMREFLSNASGDRIHPEWGPIINELRALP